jgi:hypothetical protein
MRIEFYEGHIYDGQQEIMAQVHGLKGWNGPALVCVWRDDRPDSESQEDRVELNGYKFAYCICDNALCDYRITPKLIDVVALDPMHALVIGQLVGMNS